jgi:hypothetical protein
MLKINGAWYINQLPEHLVLELADNRLVMVRMSPFRQLANEDFLAYNGHHPRRCKGQPLPDYLYRFYGLEKSDETANEVIHVRLTPTEKTTIQTAADGAGKTVSELVREWVRTL